jgi:hypothetical protein
MNKLALSMIVASLVATACGSENASTSPGQTPCRSTPSPVAAPSFPDGFPPITGVTWSSDQVAGPSQIVQGYTGGTLEDVFGEMKEKFGGGGYSVSKSERDRHDAEVNFTSARNTGQVRLSEECRGRLTVFITIRPKL